MIEIIKGDFKCDNNKLSTLEHLLKVEGGVLCDNYLFEEMIKITKPPYKSYNKHYNKLRKWYNIILGDKCEEYFKPIERNKKLKQLGI